MSYEVLARKWRPQRFEDVVGQEHVTTTLANALGANRVAHAYLFNGPRGVGKTTTARILAKALNCDQGPTATPCGKCTPCTEIARGSSMDCLEIDGASNRGIEEIRGLRERIGFAPVGGKRKVYIIDEVHMLTMEAFNALLKTLEEPPPHAIFIFATTHPRKVPPTIISRCQRFTFRRIPTAAIEKHLAMVAKSEGMKIDAEALALVSRRADGSLRDAESLLEQVSSLAPDKVTAEACRSFLGVLEDDIFFRAGEALLAGDGHGLMTLLEELVRQGSDPLEFAEGLTGHLRHLLIYTVDAKSPALSELSSEELKRYGQAASGTDSAVILGALETVGALLAPLRQSPQPRLELEVALLSLAARMASGEVGSGAGAGDGGSRAKVSARGASAPAGRKPASSPAPGKRRAEGTEGAPAGMTMSEADEPGGTFVETPARRTPRANPSRPAAASGGRDGVLPLEDVHGVWGRFVDEVSRQRRALGAFLQPAVPQSVDGDRVVLGFPPEHKFSMAQIERREHQTLLSGILGDLLGSKVRLACRPVAGGASAAAKAAADGVPRHPASSEGSPSADVPPPARRAIEEEPDVRRYLDAFSGKILGVDHDRQGDA